MLVLALVWWAWSAFVWAANAEATDSPTLRLTLLLATVFIFVAGLAVPRAWGREATLFVCAYAVVRLLHLALYVYESRAGNASLSAISGFAVTVVIGMVLLIAGSFLHGLPRGISVGRGGGDRLRGAGVVDPRTAARPPTGGGGALR